MDDRIWVDLLAAHADSILAEDEAYYERFSVLFPTELETLSPLLQLAERLRGLFRGAAPVRPTFRAQLKADLIAEARQQQFSQSARANWHWAAALGASAAVVIAAAAWRGSVPTAMRR